MFKSLTTYIAFREPDELDIGEEESTRSSPNLACDLGAGVSSPNGVEEHLPFFL